MLKKRYSVSICVLCANTDEVLHDSYLNTELYESPISVLPYVNSIIFSLSKLLYLVKTNVYHTNINDDAGSVKITIWTK